LGTIDKIKSKTDDEIMSDDVIEKIFSDNTGLSLTKEEQLAIYSSRFGTNKYGLWEELTPDQQAIFGSE
jgi:hypothetical protein